MNFRALPAAASFSGTGWCDKALFGVRIFNKAQIRQWLVSAKPESITHLNQGDITNEQP